jgi:hypothetical protein
MRLWTDPALRDAYAKVIHEALKNAITGKLAMEEVGLTLADIIANQVHGELTILGLRDDFTHCIEAIRNIVLGRVLAKMANMQTRFGLRDEHDDAH